MQPRQIRIQLGFKRRNRDPVGSARSSIGANALPRKLQVLA